MDTNYIHPDENSDTKKAYGKPIDPTLDVNSSSASPSTMHTPSSDASSEQGNGTTSKHNRSTSASCVSNGKRPCKWVGFAAGALAFLLAGIFAGVQLGNFPQLRNTLSPSQKETAPQEQKSEGPRQPIGTTTAHDAAKKALPSVVSIGVAKQNGSGVGSGVALDAEGNILTNYHVVEGAQAVSVTIANKTYPAQVVGSDPSSDIAVVKADLQGDKITPMKVADSDQLSVGDWVMSVGSPYGLNQSVSAGIVSSLARNQSLTTKTGTTTLYTNLIQTDASINPGNSGGALVNSNGELVGICTLFSSSSGAFSGIGFAIPSNYATSVAQKIIKGEKVTHAYIGLSMQTINAQNAQHYRLPVTAGAFVAEVVKGGPAEKAGIMQGDIITRVNDQEITSADAMILAVRSFDIGKTIKVTVKRGNEEKQFDVTLGSDEALQEQQKLLRERMQPRQNPNADPNAGIPRGRGDENDELLEQIKRYIEQRQDN